MFYMQELKQLREAIRSNDYEEVCRQIKELENQGITAAALENDDFGELPNSLITVAVVRADPAILQALIHYGLDPRVEIGRNHPLYIAAEYNRPEHAAILLKNGVSVEASSSKTSLSPLYVADRWGANETKTVLLQHGAQVHPQHPLTDNKISPKKLEELLSQHQGTEIKLAELLRSKGFALSLSGFHLRDDLIKKFSMIDFSNLDLNDCIIIISEADSVNFERCNLGNTYIDIQNSPANLDFSEANTFNAIFVGDPKLADHLKKSQFDSSNFLAIPPKNRFKQSKIISAYEFLVSHHSQGACFALCIEYMLRSKKHSSAAKFIEKLQRKFERKSDKFAARISFFQEYSRPLYEGKDAIRIDNQDIMNQKVIDRIFSQISGDFIHLALSFTHAIDGHAVIVKKMNSASGIYYQIYDPNIGESVPLSEAGANNHIKALIGYYKRVFSDERVTLSAENLEERYENTIRDQVRPTK